MTQHRGREISQRAKLQAKGLRVKVSRSLIKDKKQSDERETQSSIQFNVMCPKERELHPYIIIG